MPHNKIHEELSKKRTGKSFADLHDWMCGAGLTPDEIAQRHKVTSITNNLPYVRERWGYVGVQEYLYHIQDDYERNPGIRLMKFCIRNPVIRPVVRVASCLYTSFTYRFLLK